MFSSQKLLDKKTGPFGVGRRNYLQELVTEYQDGDREEAKLQVLANLANFAYDPVNYPYFQELNILTLFLDCLRERPVDSLFVQYAVGGLCNACLDKSNKQFILGKSGVQLVINCLSSSEEETVVSAITTLMFLVTPDSKPEITSAPVIGAMLQFSECDNPRLANLGKIFLQDYCTEDQITEAKKFIESVE